MPDTDKGYGAFSLILAALVRRMMLCFTEFYGVLQSSAGFPVILPHFLGLSHEPVHLLEALRRGTGVDA